MSPVHFFIQFQITNQMLCEYFRQFGAIERVQILQERLKFFDILPAIGTSSGFVDQPPNQRKYYAYVTFVNTLSASGNLCFIFTTVIVNYSYV